MTRSNAMTKLSREMPDYAGLVDYRRARSTGTFVGLYKSSEAGMEEDPELPWTTVCEEHSTLVCHRTRALAASHLPHPEEWCEDCQKEHP